MPPGFDRLESFGHDELTAKHCYVRCSRPPDVDGMIKMTRPQNPVFILTFCSLVILIRYHIVPNYDPGIISCSNLLPRPLNKISDYMRLALASCIVYNL